MDARANRGRIETIRRVCGGRAIKTAGDPVCNEQMPAVEQGRVLVLDLRAAQPALM